MRLNTMATFADLGPWKGNDNLIGLDSRIKNLIVVILWKENIDNVSQPQNCPVLKKFNLENFLN